MTEKNYFELVNPNWETTDFDLSQRKDPDCCCKELYEDFCSFLNKKREFPNKQVINVTFDSENRNKFNQLYLFTTINDNIEIQIGTDFIGPSSTWANPKLLGIKENKLKDKSFEKYSAIGKHEILKSLNDTRNIGGHMIWPRVIDGKYGLSINKERGGEYGLYDRIDLTLFVLQKWYRSDAGCFPLKNIFEKNRLWLEKFVDFKRFIKFFLLEDFTIQQNGESDEPIKIKDLTSKEDNTALSDNSCIEIPRNSDDYKEFMAKNEKAIKDRTKRILQYCKTTS
jgi:hypothetical protein